MLTRFLFLTCLVLAGALALAITVAPWFAAGPGTPLRFLADDVTVRRTGWACAFGLAITAFLFFRPRRQVEAPKRTGKNAPPGNIAGA